MASLLIFALVSNLFLTDAQVYLPAPTNIQPEDPYSTVEIFKQLQVEANQKPEIQESVPEIQIQPPGQDYFTLLSGPANDYSTLPQQQNFEKFLTKYAAPVKEAETFQSSFDENDAQSKPSRYYPDYHTKPKKKNFPKKYRKSSYKKLKHRPKINPIDEAIQDFSVDSLKNKRRIPISFTGPSQQLTNPFSSELNSLQKSRNEYSAGFPERSSAFSSPSGLGDGERMQYQMFGMDGPHSYKFGYDTGKGHNRHFRFEERDNAGKVKGHYGFYDQEGKMSMIHYEADPHTGYRAGPYHHPENHHDFDYNHQNSGDYGN